MISTSNIHYELGKKHYLKTLILNLQKGTVMV